MKKFIGISETLLIPLWARAYETQREKPIIQDFKAVDIITSLVFKYYFCIAESVTIFYKILL